MSEIRFSTLTAGPFETNCYIIWDSDSFDAAIIDPGGGYDEIIAAVESNGLRVKWILLTHGHLDHAYFVRDLAAHFGARIGGHEADIPHIKDTVGMAAMFYDMDSYVPFDLTDLLTDGSVISLGKSSIEVICTPGHSAGGISFVTSAGVFCGDALFAGSVGRTDFPGGDHDQLISSIKSRLLTLKDETPLFPGHGPSTTVGIERARNPYLQ